MFTEAFEDLKREVREGKTVVEVVREIAADYNVNAKLLERKFFESFKDEAACRAFAMATDPEKNRVEHVERQVDRMCKKWNVATEGCTRVKYRGEVFTIVGRYKNRLQMVRESDGWRCAVNARAWAIMVPVL